MFHGKKVRIDETMLDELKDLLGIDCDAEAVDEAVRRIIELEETLFLLAQMGSGPRKLRDWEEDPDAWRHEN